MRANLSAQLQIYCSRCGNKANEYNWTLETASKFSVPGRATPTLIYILQRLDEGDRQWESFRVVCPRCHETLPLQQLPFPGKTEMQAYIDAVGQEYVNHCF